MYLAIDIGGTKTLVAVFSADGKIVYEEKMVTGKTYANFLSSLGKVIAKTKTDYKLEYCCCAVPGQIDRKRGIALRFGNLPWTNVSIQQDLAELVGTSVVIENDANLAGLSEALLVHDKYKKVLYLTISTGIGDGIIMDGKIDPVFADGESGQMVLNYNGSLQKWESFASGRALKAKYGKLASEIKDPAIWQEYVKALAPGISELVATITPDVIIIGGGVGAHYEKFGEFLKQELKNYEDDMVQMPPIIKAKRPEEAVIYGCYDFIRSKS